MNLWDALLLGIIQGITEFFPVSSSGHLILAEYFLGFQSLEQYVLFDLFCHLGTMGAILLVFSSSIKELFADRTKALQIAIAVLPLFPLVLLVKQIKFLFDQPHILGYCFLITAFIIYLGQRFGKNTPVLTPYKAALGVGLAQACAIIPGVSRSGTTISAARMLGWQPQEAVTFSFLLSIPTILGGMILESYKLLSQPLPSIPWIAYIVGAITAFGIGLIALKFLMYIVANNKFALFGFYCLFVGFATLLYFSL